MPLPQALAAKLAKRGIIKLPSQPKEPDPPVTNNNLQEEIIAEDYDDTPQLVDTPVPPPPEKFDKFQGWFSCPNKWNVYHECSPACQDQWKEVKEVEKEYNRKRVRMLLKYPLPAHWQEVLDTGLRRYYYWNTEKDVVAWLPPGHPKCRVSLSAAQLRKQMTEERDERLKEEKKGRESPLGEGVGADRESEEEEEGREKEEVEESSEEEKEETEEGTKRKRKEEDSANEELLSSDSADEEKAPKEKRLKEKARERERRPQMRGGRAKERKRVGGKRRGNDESDVLDPMDPAAYSECPRGTWSSGLPEKNEARTGVDPTASGPLFQMRPYPNPGAVLRANSAVNSVGPKKPA